MRVAERLVGRAEDHGVRVLERGAGHYEVEEVSFGRVYRWRPEHVLVECECGETSLLTRSSSTCECGTDHSRFFEEGSSAAWQEDEASHPWRDAGDQEDTGLPC